LPLSSKDAHNKRKSYGSRLEAFMLVGMRMTFPVITVHPEMSLVEAFNLMKQSHIRRTPVVKDGILVGIVSDKDLLNASPPPATSLSVWEMNFLLSKITIREVMTSNVLTVTEDTTIEEAARIMVDNKIGGLPVVSGEKVVGIITETDLFKVYLEMTGAREPGVRVTCLIPEQRGQLARLTQAIAIEGGNFVAFGQYTGKIHPLDRLLTFKVTDISKEAVIQAINPYILKIIDIRVS
jgi:acetoin utilization protein AcuB